MQDFIEWLNQSGRTNTTISSYKLQLQVFAEWFQQTNGRPLEPTELTPSDIRDFRSYLLTVRRTSPSTVNHYLAALRLYGQWAEETGQISASPARKVRGVAAQRLAPRWIDRLQQHRLLRAIEGREAASRTIMQRNLAVRDKAIVLMLLHTGLRIGELCNLHLDQLTMASRSGNVTLVGKGAKAREVPLNSTVREALRDYLDTVRGRDPGLLFEVSARMVQSRMQQLSEQTGIELTPHVLRHSAAHNLIGQGVSIDQVAAILGHSDLETTRRYTMPSQADLQAAVDRLDE